MNSSPDGFQMHVIEVDVHADRCDDNSYNEDNGQNGEHAALSDDNSPIENNGQNKCNNLTAVNESSKEHLHESENGI